MAQHTLGPQITLGLTFDDVLLVPQYSEILPQQTDLSTRVSRHFKLKSPIISAAMDTVTEAKTAIAMAQNGGLGVLHKNMSCEAQAREVEKVKKSESGMITNPITIRSTDTVGQVIAIMETHNISGLPVIDGERLVGIVTGRDIRFETDPHKKVSEVMTKNVVTANEGTSSEEAVVILHKHRIEKLPVIAAKTQRLIGLFTIKDIEKSRRFPQASKDSTGRLLAAAAIGVSGDYLERTEALLAAQVDILVVDTAHGHSRGVLEAIKVVKKDFGKRYTFDVIGGNIATAAAAQALIDAGVDGIKVGIGPGSICTTRIISGVGVPQLSAIMDCAHVSKKAGVALIADGGIKFSGDVVKALAAGADTVMIGSIFAGTDEAPGELIIYQGKSYKSYRGMGSLAAMEKGGKERYFQGDVEEMSKLVPEGIEGRVAYKGSLASTLYQITGGIKSAMGYLGAAHISALQERAKFVQITSAGLKESHAHDVYITREAPNYKLD